MNHRCSETKLTNERLNLHLFFQCKIVIRQQATSMIKNCSCDTTQYLIKQRYSLLLIERSNSNKNLADFLFVNENSSFDHSLILYDKYCFKKNDFEIEEWIKVSVQVPQFDDDHHSNSNQVICIVTFKSLQTSLSNCTDECLRVLIVQSE